jgi:hypothetical protein
MLLIDRTAKSTLSMLRKLSWQLLIAFIKGTHRMLGYISPRSGDDEDDKKLELILRYALKFVGIN